MAVRLELLPQQRKGSCTTGQEKLRIRSALDPDWRGVPPASQSLIVLSFDPDTIFLPSGDHATEFMSPPCALALSLDNSRVAALQARGELKPGGTVGGTSLIRALDGVPDSPESQTRIIASYDPDTIAVPSG